MLFYKKNLIFILLFSLIAYPIYSQKIYIGKGVAYYKKHKDENKARNEAILQSQVNALLSYGGVVQSFDLKIAKESSSKIRKKKRVKVFGKYTSEFYSFTSNSIKGLVQATSTPEIEEGKIGRKKFFKATGKYTIKPENFKLTLNEFISYTGNTINIYFAKNQTPCNEHIYDYLSEHLNKENKNFTVSSEYKFIAIQVSNKQNYLTIDVYIKKILEKRNWLILSDEEIEIKKYKTYNIKLSKNESCDNLVIRLTKTNGIFDEILSDINKKCIIELFSKL